MPIRVDLPEPGHAAHIESVFGYFRAVDERFSTYKDGSEISRINRGEIDAPEYSGEMREVFALARKAKRETGGYFDIKRPDGSIDPSGAVKGWAINNAARILDASGVADYLIDASGDIALSGMNERGADWSVGIRNPFESGAVVTVVYPRGRGIATSGSYLRGAHIYDPHDPSRPLDEIVSITVIGRDVLEADLYATAAFAMGRAGLRFIESKDGLEAYMIDRTGLAASTSGFAAFTLPSAP